MFDSVVRRDPIAAHARSSVAQREVGTDASCTCGETRPRALQRHTSGFTCALCTRCAEGKAPHDKHHISGKANSHVIILVPVNDHRAQISVNQYNWPKRTLENADGSPLLSGAACIRGFVDIVDYLTEIEVVSCFIEQFLLWIAVMLETLDEFLVSLKGRQWWVETKLQTFAPEVSNGKK